MLLQDISQIDPLPRHPVRNHRDRDQEPNPVHGWNGKPEVIALEAHTLKSIGPRNGLGGDEWRCPRSRLLLGDYFPLARDPGVSGIDSRKPASVLILPSMPSPALVRDDG